MKFSTILPLTASACLTAAIQLSATPSKDDLANAASQVAENMLTFYNGDKPGGIPGYMLNPDYYFWWQTGGMLGQLINYWSLTGDDKYNNIVTDAVTFQSQDNVWFMPNNQSTSEGNDDQAFWAFAALDAAEVNFPKPGKDKDGNQLEWIALAQAVFNTQSTRWKDNICGGGLEWQINPLNKGADYKNMPSNGGYFLQAARLAHYTGNDTYVDQAKKMWDWLEQVTLISADTQIQGALQVWDGVHDGSCAAGRSPDRFTYNNAMLAVGSAYLFSHTKDPIWENRTQSLVKGFQDVFLVKFGATGINDGFQGEHNVLTETICEFQDSCNSDQPSFKAYVLRWLTVATQLVPSIQPDVQKMMDAAIKGAAAQCTGQAPGNARTKAGLSHATPGTGDNWCGQHWYMDKWDGWSGLGEQMSALSAFQNYIVFLNGGPAANNGSASGGGSGGSNGGAPGGGAPLTANTGGSSVSDPSAGANAYEATLTNEHWKTITGADKFGAAVMTILGCLIPVGGLWWMFMSD